MNLEKEFFRGLTPEIRFIREKVFVEEQGFQDEFDEADKSALHLVLYYNGKAVATGRILEENNTEKTYTIGRVAVLLEYRKLRLGIKVLELLEKKAQEIGARKIKLSAQCRAQGFYEQGGYLPQGEVYYDEFCPHILMVKNL